MEDPIGKLAIRTTIKSEIMNDGLSGIDFIDENKYLAEIKAASELNEDDWPKEDFWAR